MIVFSTNEVGEGIEYGVNIFIFRQNKRGSMDASKQATQAMHDKQEKNSLTSNSRAILN